MTAPRRKLSTWTLALLVVLGLHLAVGAWALYWQVQTPPVEPTPPAMLVELAPLPAVPPPAAPPPPRSEPEPEAPKPPPKLVEAAKPELALPPPKPKPKPKPKPPTPKPQPVAPAEPLAAAPLTPTPPAPPAPAAAAPAAPQPAVTPPSQSNATSEEAIWNAKLSAYLNKRVKYPDAARRSERVGTIRHVTLRFVVNAQGEVTNYSISKSSGSPVFDRAALQVIKRAGTLPAPPATALTNGHRDVIYPISYQMER